MRRGMVTPERRAWFLAVMLMATLGMVVLFMGSVDTMLAVGFALGVAVAPTLVDVRRGLGIAPTTEWSEHLTRVSESLRKEGTVLLVVPEGARAEVVQGAPSLRWIGQSGWDHTDVPLLVAHRAKGNS